MFITGMLTPPKGAFEFGAHWATVTQPPPPVNALPMSPEMRAEWPTWPPHVHGACWPQLQSEKTTLPPPALDRASPIVLYRAFVALSELSIDLSALVKARKAEEGMCTYHRRCSCRT